MSVAVQAADWTAREAELVGLHQLCDRGDRKACVRFGMLLGEAKERHGDWRRAHAKWWWIEQQTARTTLPTISPITSAMVETISK